MCYLKVTDILARLAICEKASIDECYLDITAEARRRMEASEQLQLPVNSHQVHVCGEASLASTFEYNPLCVLIIKAGD